MSKHNISFWSGRPYRETREFYATGRNKKQKNSFRYKRKEQDKTLILGSGTIKLIKHVHDPAERITPQKQNTKKKNKNQNTRKKKTQKRVIREKQTICFSCKNFDNENKLCLISKSDRGLVLHCLFFKL